MACSHGGMYSVDPKLVRLDCSSSVNPLGAPEKTGVLVRDCSTFTGMGSQHVRIAVRTHKENVMLVKALEEMDNGKAR